MVVLAMAAVSGSGFLGLFSILDFFRPGDARVRKDLEELKDGITDWVTELIPLRSGEDLDIFSYHQSKFSDKGRRRRRAKGVFTSIYHEPMVAWSFRAYSGGQAILFVRTAHQAFSYRFRKDRIDIAISNGFVGRLSKEGVLTDTRQKRVYGRYQQIRSREYIPIQIGQEEVGSIIIPDDPDHPIQRAFAFLSSLTEDERDLFLALSILYMIRYKLELLD
jgi:hypothetical protein